MIRQAQSVPGQSQHVSSLVSARLSTSPRAGRRDPIDDDFIHTSTN